MLKIYDNVKITHPENHKLNGNFIGDNCLIFCKKLVMERGSQINANSILAGRGEIYIGENGVVGYGCLLLTSVDTPNSRFMNDASLEDERAIKTGNIFIRHNATVGSHSIIFPGVNIGEYSVVAAGSFINKDVPPKTIVIPKQKLIIKSRKLP